MTFEERKRIASELVVGFLSDYSPPRGLDASQQASRIAHAADAFARRMPTDGDYSEKVDSVLTKIRDTHLSNSWPAQAAFVMAMPKGEFRGAAPQTFSSDDPDRIPRMMSQGLKVPEFEVWKNQQVSRDVLDRYRIASVENWNDVYGREAEDMLAEKYGGVVRGYFQVAAE
ncbi:hypothetical protein [uncultured Roseobacter sp.]|uniref:hypothetical protein n=1 Tax=uncultured Roseobacter sp. TaxID=114847 RepID=UPI00260F56B8|nr:hypothetical protein [uncultured Roseobacter sp.]